MATFIAQQSEGSSKIITVKPLKHKQVKKEHKETEHQHEIESGDETLLTTLGKIASLKGGSYRLKMQSECLQASGQC